MSASYSDFGARGEFTRLFRASIILCWLSLASAADAPEHTSAQSSPAALTVLSSVSPEEVGFSSERLQRISQMIYRSIERKDIPGAVALVARGGRIAYFEAQGAMDLETKMPMRKDALFRLTSMTKPVTAAAIMILMEEGKLRLTDPVSQYIPEFKGAKVAVTTPSAADYSVVPASRDITIRDLLTHTSGLAGGKITSKEFAQLRAARKPTETLADYVPRMGLLPLAFQPGTRWSYSDAGFEVLARVVEITSCTIFDRFLRQRLFEPLGMKDTFFAVPEDKRSRAVANYRGTPKGLEKSDNPLPLVATQYYFSGSGGLISTAEDFMRFGQMLCNGGELNGQRLLSPRTIDLMTSNSVGELFNGQIRRPAQGMGFGFGGEIVLDTVMSGIRRSNGSYGWDGAFGTHWWVSRQERLVAIFMIQVQNQEMVDPLHRDFENAVMQAILE